MALQLDYQELLQHLLHFGVSAALVSSHLHGDYYFFDPIPICVIEFLVIPCT